MVLDPVSNGLNAGLDVIFPKSALAPLAAGEFGFPGPMDGFSPFNRTLPSPKSINAAKFRSV